MTKINEIEGMPLEQKALEKADEIKNGQEQLMVSAAISLKRIADALEKLAGDHGVVSMLDEIRLSMPS